jgi:hypothetical protein
MPTLEDHPLAAVFPLMPDPDLAALADDIAARGLLEPIWLYEGKILDGRNRYRACVAKGLAPRVEHYRGTDPLGVVVSRNLHRRHLTESQRAMAAARIANMKVGNPSFKAVQPNPANLPDSAPPVSQADAAKLLNVSDRSVRHAVRVIEGGTPELVAAVDRGEVAVSAAAERGRPTEADIAFPEMPDPAAAFAARLDTIRLALDAVKRDVQVMAAVPGCGAGFDAAGVVAHIEAAAGLLTCHAPGG